MASRIDIVLRKLPEQLQAIRDQYERDLASREISDDLLHDIARFIEDCQRVLDWTATDIDKAYGSARDRSPYFPLQSTPEKFAGAMKRDFPSVPKPIYDAIERHQPYQSGKGNLGHIHELARVNKHQDFTAQTRTETRRIRASGPSGTVEWTPYEPGKGGVRFGGGVFINGVPIDPRTQRPIPSQLQEVTETVYVGWRFRNPDVPVVPTLESIHSLVIAAMTEVRQTARL